MGAGRMTTRIAARALARVMDRALLRRGMAGSDRDDVVDSLIETSLRGVDTHGVRLFPTYLAELDGGRARARPEMTWPHRRHSAATLDAGHALGIVAGLAAAREAARLAAEQGVGAVAVRNSNHFGAASCYSLAIARRGMIGLAFTNSDALVAPFQGLRPAFGTNPLSVAARSARGELFCVDMATSQVAYSKVKHCREQGLGLEPGWAITADGSDAAGAPGDVAALQPLGGYKGQGLVMIVELLCALLAGMPLDHELTHLYGEPWDQPRRVSHFFIALDVAAFGEPRSFRARLDELMAFVRRQDARAGAAVIVPGDLERDSAEARHAGGIPLTAAELEQFRQIDAEDGGREGELWAEVGAAAAAPVPT